MDNQKIVGSSTGLSSLPENKPQSVASVYPEPAKGFGVAKPPIAQATTGGEAAPQENVLNTANNRNDEPVAVVKVLSVRGVEYLFMSIALWLAAAGLTWNLIALVNGNTGFEMLAFPLTLLLVCLPVFAFFFIRLKKAELENPAYRLDPSKRRLSQITQVLAFLTCLFNLITFVYLAISSFSGESKVSIGKAALNMAIILLVAGGILAYYWHDEHKQSRQ